MILELPWAQKRMFWAFEKSIFCIFESFWVTKLKPFSGKVRQSAQNYLNKSMVIGSFLKMVLKRSWAQKDIFWALEKNIFWSFASFCVTKLKTFSGKVRESLQNYLNQNLVIGNFLENDFEGTFSSKANVLRFWTKHFPIFCKFYNDKVETIFWESEAKRSKLFKSKFGHTKVFRKMFWSYFELKNECSGRWKNGFFIFLQVFQWWSWKNLLEKCGKAFKTI